MARNSVVRSHARGQKKHEPFQTRPVSFNPLLRHQLRRNEIRATFRRWNFRPSQPAKFPSSTRLRTLPGPCRIEYQDSVPGLSSKSASSAPTDSGAYGFRLPGDGCRGGLQLHLCQVFPPRPELHLLPGRSLCCHPFVHRHHRRRRASAPPPHGLEGRSHLLHRADFLCLSWTVHLLVVRHQAPRLRDRRRPHPPAHRDRYDGSPPLPHPGSRDRNPGGRRKRRRGDRSSWHTHAGRSWRHLQRHGSCRPGAEPLANDGPSSAPSPSPPSSATSSSTPPAASVFFSAKPASASWYASWVCCSSPSPCSSSSTA